MGKKGTKNRKKYLLHINIDIKCILWGAACSCEHIVLTVVVY